MCIPTSKPNISSTASDDCLSLSARHTIILTLSTNQVNSLLYKALAIASL